MATCEDARSSTLFRRLVREETGFLSVERDLVVRRSFGASLGEELLLASADRFALPDVEGFSGAVRACLVAFSLRGTLPDFTSFWGCSPLFSFDDPLDERFFTAIKTFFPAVIKCGTGHVASKNAGAFPIPPQDDEDSHIEMELP
ncbi:MAG: hypothetical protein SNJ52_02560 [Verrucomicrobiia bacterium]